MKNNGSGGFLTALTTALTGAVMISALTTAWVSWRYFITMRQWQKLQGQYATMTATRTAAQSLANEAVEYSNKNTNINAVLFEFEIKPRPGTNRPSTAVNPGIQPTRPIK